jgi:hypothetical protein|tara:strand:+ start:3003 stop:3620 length:618 start_codon:yes stop_codon:yes gene_type:complete
MDNIDDVLNVVERWGTLGLLDGLPILDKTELAQIYDNATRLMLSTVAIKKIPKNISNIYDEVYIPICRRLYKRLGPNFNLDTMMSQLLEVVNKGGKDIFKVDSENPTDNPIVDFCVDFADGYEDELTNKTTLTDKEYQEKINKVLDITKSVLLNESLVSYVNNSNGEYKIELSKAKKNTQQTRFWNQSVAKSFVNSTLSEINKGL